jgi:putative hydrolases of HD superfamily
MTDRLEKQIQFLIEIDKLKHVFRRTRLFNQSRYENDAEHGWHMSIMALIFAEYANDLNINVYKVIKMALIHDIVEIDAGDTFLYAENIQEKKYNLEKAAAFRIFGLLPEDQRDEFIALWEEFEKKETPEAKFAGSLDRLGPVMQNYFDNGHAWQKNSITSDKVMSVNSQIEKGSVRIWDYAKSLIEESLQSGNLKNSNI